MSGFCRQSCDSDCCGDASSANIVGSADTARSRGVRRVGTYMVTKTMSSTVSACIATPFGIKGINYSITSTCATGRHYIGAAVEQVQWGKQDIVFAGGEDEEAWSLAMMFDAMCAGVLEAMHCLLMMEHQQLWFRRHQRQPGVPALFRRLIRRRLIRKYRRIRTMPEMRQGGFC